MPQLSKISEPCDLPYSVTTSLRRVVNSIYLVPNEGRADEPLPSINPFYILMKCSEVRYIRAHQETYHVHEDRTGYEDRTEKERDEKPVRAIFTQIPYPTAKSLIESIPGLFPVFTQNRPVLDPDNALQIGHMAAFIIAEAKRGKDDVGENEFPHWFCRTFATDYRRVTRRPTDTTAADYDKKVKKMIIPRDQPPNTRNPRVTNKIALQDIPDPQVTWAAAILCGFGFEEKTTVIGGKTYTFLYPKPNAKWALDHGDTRRVYFDGLTIWKKKDTDDTHEGWWEEVHVGEPDSNSQNK